MDEAHDFILTPHGPIHRNCVHVLEAGEVRGIYTACSCPPTHPRQVRQRYPAGWIESATFTPSEPLGSMRVKFNVPEPPAENGSLIYLFPGAQDAFGSTILQPVLQWGHNRQFGGEHWTIACWQYSPEGHSFVSPHYIVSPGQTIFASIQLDKGGCGADSCDWIVKARVEEEPDKCAELRVPGLKQLLLLLIGGALEAYSLPSGDPLRPGTDSCRLFPRGETVFSGINLVDLNNTEFHAHWGTRFPEVCGFGVEVSDHHQRITVKTC